MNLTISGRHGPITPAIRSYVESKLSRIRRHFDHVIDVNVVLSATPLAQMAEVTSNVAGTDIFVDSDDKALYAANDALAANTEPPILNANARPRTPRLDEPGPGGRDSSRQDQGPEGGGRGFCAPCATGALRRSRRQARQSGVRAAGARAGDRTTP